MAIKNKYSDIDLSKYAKGYQASKQVKDAQKLKTQAEKAVRNYGDFKYGNQGAYDKAMNDILNRKSFSYDLNGDALYQQYKDMYMSQGKLAMADTMGQAAALTGGYGNSYAASVGNQAYQGYLQQLNGVIPELYNLALSAYNAEGDRLNNNFNLLSTDRSTQYGEYTDKYNRLVNDRGYYSDNYNNIYNQDYSKFTDNRNYDQSQYWNEYNAGYQKDRDAIADAQWQKQFDESVRQFNISSARSGGRGASPEEVEYSQIKQFNKEIASEDEFKENSEVITRGNRGNTGNGGFRYNGKIYNSYDDYRLEELMKHYETYNTINEATYRQLLIDYGYAK